MKLATATRGRGLRLGLVVCLCLGVGWFSQAHALDFGDVTNLIRNDVPESVIVNLVHANPGLTITSDQVQQLRGMGVSENLVAVLESNQAATTTIMQENATTYYVDPEPSVTVTSSPTVVYEQPATTYYYSQPPVYSSGPSFGIWFGSGDRYHNRPGWGRPPHSGGWRPGGGGGGNHRPGSPGHGPGPRPRPPR